MNFNFQSVHKLSNEKLEKKNRRLEDNRNPMETRLQIQTIW